MRNSERTSPYPPLQVRAGILVVDGHGIALTTERGRLVAQEGGGARRLVLDRAACGLERIALVGWTGSISLEALRWLKGIGAVLVAFGPDGDLLHTSVPSGYGGLARRAQALAPSLGLDVDIARELLLGKLAGQRTNLIRLAAAGAIVAVDDEREALLHADDVATLRLCEARAAVAYWRAWQGLPMRFAPKDLVRIPARWTRHGGRASLLTGTPRGATTPHNAILNFLYALLESEARLALHVAGLDPTLGVLHLDTPGRDSLALDAIEPLRWAVDAYVLDLMRDRVFTASDFSEWPNGTCRLAAPLVAELCATLLRWRSAVGPVVARLASLFRAAAAGRTRVNEAPQTKTRPPGKPRSRSYRAALPSLFPNACATCNAARVVADAGTARRV